MYLASNFPPCYSLQHFQDLHTGYHRCIAWHVSAVHYTESTSVSQHQGQALCLFAVLAAEVVKQDLNINYILQNYYISLDLFLPQTCSFNITFFYINRPNDFVWCAYQFCWDVSSDSPRYKFTIN